jgi:hypothetical protein
VQKAPGCKERIHQQKSKERRKKKERKKTGAEKIERI